MNLINRLLNKNMSPARIAGFVVSNFIGLAIVTAGIQFFQDVRSIYSDADSFLKKDYLVVNKRVTSANTTGRTSASFSADEIADISAQPWVRRAAPFTSTDFRVMASMTQNGRGMSTSMFFEAIPSDFIDVGRGAWHWEPGSHDVPVIISKDYLTLYNFGFAASAGLPQLSEKIMGGIPLGLELRSEDGTRSGSYTGRIAGFSNRLNTILVPEEFMAEANRLYGTPGHTPAPSRLIIDVSSPGDVAITRYLEEHDLETAGDKKGSQATFLLNVVTGIVLAVGVVITVLSLFILLLSMSILMEKNRDKLHTLLMLGAPLKEVGAPYRRAILVSCASALVISLAAVYLFRLSYIGQLRALGGGSGALWAAPLAAVVLTAAVAAFNLMAVKRRVRQAWR